MRKKGYYIVYGNPFPERMDWVTTPEKANMARRPFLSSWSLTLSTCSFVLPSRNCFPIPKSPGSRPDPCSIWATPSQETISAKASQIAMLPMAPYSQSLSWAVAEVRPSHSWGMATMRTPRSTVTHPVQASMQMRPCLSSASRR